MAALAIAVVASMFHAAYVEREVAVQTQTEHYAKAIEAHVVNAIQSVDLTLMGFANAIKVLPPQQSHSPEIMAKLLSAHSPGFDSDYWFTFIDPKGKAIANSSGDEVLGVSYADRDYFRAQLGAAYRGKLFVGEPAIGKVSKKRLFFLSRRVEDAQGEFLGVIAAPINADRFVQVFENSRFNSRVSISLVHRSGLLIARMPDHEHAFARDLQHTDLFEQIQRNGSGTYKTRSPIDHVSRIFSYRAIESLPLIIVAGSNDDESARLLHQSYRTAGGGLAILLLLMLAAGHFSLRTYGRQLDREDRYRLLYTASREMERQLLENEEQRKKNEESLKLAALLFQNSSEGMMVTDAHGKILAVNPAFSQVSGYADDEVIGKHAWALASSRNDKEFFTGVFESVSKNGHWKGELWHKGKDGGEYLMSILVNTVHDNHGTPFRYVALLSDITKKKASEELIWRQANFDALTGLPNRSMFNEHLRLEMKKTDRSQLPMALLFIDLDYFKEVNDTLGHDQGDLLLKEVAARLSACVRNTDIVARLGGDEFTVILSELRNIGDVVRTAQEILRKMSTPFHLGEHFAHISASIGIALYPVDGTDAETLIKNADQAMYTAKEEGRNRFNYFAPVMQEDARSRLTLVNDLREALLHDQLRILYQPIVELASGAIVKAEALVRWQHPVRGLLNPADFIGLAESSGLIMAIGDWVFQQAAHEVKKLMASGAPGFQISVNKSAWQFRDDGSNYRQWLDFLRELNLDPHSIIIEVTENLLLESDRMLAFQHAHMQISLDDFGAGNCSVAVLKHFGVDYIKIAPDFVTGNSEELQISEAIIAMAHKLGIQVIAEGVETAQQLAAMKAAGCDFAQGYLFSRPISAAELEKLLLEMPEVVNK